MCAVSKVWVVVIVFVDGFIVALIAPCCVTVNKVNEYAAARNLINIRGKIKV